MRMKKVLLIFFAILSLQASSQQFSPQWQWLNPKPAGYPNVKILFSDNNNGFIFNSNGDLIRTIDAGSHWTILKNFPKAKAMDFHDSTGIIGGFSNAVHISTDNGTTWQRKIITADQDPYFPFVQAVTRDTLLALNSNGSTLYRSNDRGSTWTVVLTNILLNNNLSFQFVNSKVGFIGSYSGIQKTTNGGLTWQQVYNNQGSGILTINFFTQNLGFAFRDDSKFLKTTDGGLTWTVTNSSFDVYSFFFVNANTIYAAGEQSKIYKTTDGGANWNIISTSIGGSLYNSIYFTTPSKGFVVGSEGRILSTIDGGINWQQYAVTHDEVTTLQFPSSQVGYVTDWGKIYKSSDAGQTWQYSNLTLTNSNSKFTHSWFKNSDTGFLISQYPALFFKTYNGGQSWQNYNPFPGTYEKAWAMDFVNDSVGYLCMYNATWACDLFKTTNSGESWSFIGLSYNIFHAIDFVNAKTGYGVADHKIFKTLDSAKTWTTVDSSNDWFNGVHFINEAIGYSFGDNAFMKKTVDSGRTWTKVDIPYGHVLNAHFFDQQVGYLVNQTYNAGILKTYDAGKSWHPEFDLTLKKMTSTNDTTMYIAGHSGAILRQQIRGYNIDSLLMKNISSCGADFSAYVSVAFGNIDSISLEYGKNGLTNIVPVSPFSVTNNTIKVSRHLQDLTQNTSYIFRLKCYYDGAYIYTDVDSFKTLALAKPSITVIGDTLISSSFTNNQWFLNGQPIPGATDRIYKVTISGSYSVQVTEIGCASEMSNAANIVITAIDPVLDKELLVFPNPTNDNVYIKSKNGNAYFLEITINDLGGRQLLSLRSSSSFITIPLMGLPSGFYLINIKDTIEKKLLIKKLIKY